MGLTDVHLDESFADERAHRLMLRRRLRSIVAPPMRAVIFDMDGVLVLSEPLIAEAAIRMFAEKGVTVRAEEFRPFIGMGEDRFIGGVAERRGVKLEPARDKARTYAIYDEIVRGRLQSTPGAREFVRACRAKGLRIAVASGADRVKVDANLRELGLPPKTFDAVIDGTLVSRKKPAPDIFLAAADALHVTPDECLVIEDAVSGVTAAKAAGARALGLTTSFDARALIAAGADSTAPDLAHVPLAALDW
jgi:HAD superfamily hydrolase (TIGR01509 family)